MKLWLLILAFFLSQPAVAVPLSTFDWDPGSTEGLRIGGDISWDAKGCDFTNLDQTHAFPIFTYKKPSGKPFKDPTGSYCIRLNVPAEAVGSTLVFSMTRVVGNAELVVNEEKIWSQDYDSGPQRLQILYDIRAPILWIELKLSCNQAPSCGFRGGLHVDEQRQGMRKELQRLSYDMLAIMGGISCLFYHLIFAFLRRRSSAALFLAFNCLALMLRLLMTSQGQLHYFLGISENWYWRLESIAALILLPSTLSLVRSVFDEETPAAVPILGWTIGLGGIGFCLLNARGFPLILMIIYSIIILNVVTYVIVARRCRGTDRTGVMIFIVCSLINILTTGLESLNSRLNIEIHASLQPLGYLATMIFQSVLLATRINDAFVLAEKQEAEIKDLKGKIEFEIQNLDDKILERTAELRTIFQSISTGILWVSAGEAEQLHINSEYSEYLRNTIGFDIQSWHEMHFFLRRLSLPDMPASGTELAQWFRDHMRDKASLDRALEELLGGLRIFQDMERVRHLKFKWVSIVDGDHIKEIFLFVFDVSVSMELQSLAQAKDIQIAALRELTALPSELIIALHAAFAASSTQEILTFATTLQLSALEKALKQTSVAAFHDAYQRVLTLLFEMQNRSQQQKAFDTLAFLQLSDWKELPVDAREIFQELLKKKAA